MYLFTHPNENYYGNILDLYYRYYDILELRSSIFEIIDDNMRFGNIIEPVLLEGFNDDLKILRNEEMISLKDLPIDIIESKFEEINNKRLEIFKIFDKYLRNAFLNIRGVPNLSIHYIKLDYCEYKLDVIKREIGEWNSEEGKNDPFKLLKETYELSNEELEIIIYLYYNNFDGFHPLKGSNLLRKILGMQSNLFTDQKYLLPDGKLIKNDIIQIIDKGSDWLNSTYGISQKGNMYISFLNDSN